MSSHKTEPLELHVQESLRTLLPRSPDPDRVWLWCIFCERFFQAKFLRLDYQGNMQGCAFCRCAGFECAIFKWDAFRPGDPSWPRSTSELRHGLRLGEYMDGT